MQTSTEHKSNSSSFSNIIFNIFIPVMILNKGTKFGLTAVQAVLLALSFPLFFGLYSIIKEKKINYIALLGLANILVSGTLSILALGGIWFAVKEALFPLLIGGFVLGSSFTKSPFFKTLFLNPAAFNVTKIEEKLDTSDKKNTFELLMKHSTQWLSSSFLISAALNFILSLYIFTPLPEALSITEKQELLSKQLGQMTLYSMPMILVPMMIFVGLILYFAFKKTSSLTGLTMDDLFIK
jgi:hypothetical protein